MDSLIRNTMHESVEAEEPSASIRETLLAAAARDAEHRSAIGPVIPALVDGLCENVEVEQKSLVDLPAMLTLNRQWSLLVAPIYAVR